MPCRSPLVVAVTLALCAGAPGASSCQSPVGLATDGAWPRSPANPLLRAGRSLPDGRVERMIADPSMVFDAAAGLWRLYYATTVSRSYSDPAGDYRLVAAESPDGTRWTVLDAPALEPSAPGGWDSEHLETPEVVLQPDAVPSRRFALFYSGSSRAHPMGFADYRIGLAFSADGRTFQRLPAAESPHGEAGLLLDEADLLPEFDGLVDGVAADPDVVLTDGVWHLWASSFACGGSCRGEGDALAWGISHATSTDGVNFTAASTNPVPDLRARAGQQPSTLHQPDGSLAMWFTSDPETEKSGIPSTFNAAVGFWKATSRDGEHWRLSSDTERDFSWNRSSPHEELGLLTGVEAVARDGGPRLYFAAWSSRDVPEGFAMPTREVPFFRPGVLQLLAADQTWQPAE